MPAVGRSYSIMPGAMMVESRLSILVARFEY